MDDNLKKKRRPTPSFFPFYQPLHMIDFLKIRLDSSLSKSLLSNPLLEFIGEYSRETGEIHTYPLNAKYRNLEFEIKGVDYIILKGSIHKYAQQGWNCEDFNFSSFSSAIMDICNKFDINPHKANIINIEYGVNLYDLPLETREILKAILRYKTKSFNTMRNHKGTPVAGKDCYLQQFGIKAYDKAKQYKLDHQVFRFELKVYKMEHLHKNKILISNLSDLLIKQNLDMLGANLKAVWDELLFFDPTLYDQDLKPSERSKLAQYKRVEYWEELQAKSPKNHNYQRSKYRELQARQSKSFQEVISKTIEKKWIELSQINKKDLVKMTDLLFRHFSKNDRSSSRSFWINKIKKYLKAHDQNELLLSLQKRCRITGLDISDQQEGSKFLSEKKIGKTNAKRLRNRDSNPRNKLRYRVNKYSDQNTLFDMNEYLQLTEDQKELMNYWKGTQYDE